MMAVGKEVPDLIRLDLFMPGMGGIEVVSHLRQLPATKDVPILIITGSVEAEDLPVLDLVQGCLVKPFRLASLFSAVERVLDPDTPEEHRFVRKTLSEGKEIRGFRYWTTSAGGTVQLMADSSLVRAEDGGVLGVVFVFRDVTIEAKVEEERRRRELEVIGDRPRLRQLVVNLLQNALEAVGLGGQITAETRMVNGKGQALLRIRDNGEGIRPELLSRVCDPFFSTKEGRSGLGLSICQSITVDHGGDISLESEPGEGTVVSVWLPLP